MTSCLVYSESPELALELIKAASKIGAQEIFAVVLGSGELAEKAHQISAGAVTRIYLVSDESLKDLQAEAVVDALETVVRQSGPNFILISATKRGKEAAPRLATRVKMGCITDALEPKIEGDGLIADRLVWGGNAVAKVWSKNGTVITVPLRAFEKATERSQPSIFNVEFSPKTRGSKIVDRKEKPKGSVNLKDAQAIVSAGRGFKKKEDLAILNELASVLNAVIGASRPLTSDLLWMPEDRQVGLSGVTVKPKLYVAVGISGQIQHLTGMRDSKLVVAINNDKNAPIFQECDYGAVGDLYAIVPELTKDIKARLGK